MLLHILGVALPRFAVLEYLALVEKQQQVVLWFAFEKGLRDFLGNVGRDAITAAFEPLRDWHCEKDVSECRQFALDGLAKRFPRIVGAGEALPEIRRGL